MEIFVTGGSGFVGRATIRRLVADGHGVRAMSRTAASDERLRGLGALPARCDLGDVSAAQLAGADAVVHAAAHVADWGTTDDWDRVNVGGTQRLLAAAREAGVRRFVHIGTEAALVHGQHLRGADETYPLATSSPYPYCRTKALAEQAVRAANDPVAGFETIVLRPRFIWGPDDQTLLPRFIEMAKAGRWAWIDGGRARTSTTYVGNLVDAIVLALTRGQPGAAYFILDAGDRTMREMITAMTAAAGVTLPEKSIPYPVAATVAWVSEAAWRLLGLKGSPPLTRHAAMVMARDCVLVGEKAKRELGYEPRTSIEQGMAALKKSLAQL